MGREYYIVSDKAKIAYDIGKGYQWKDVNWNSSNLSLELNNHVLRVGFSEFPPEYLEEIAIEIQSLFTGLNDICIIPDEDIYKYEEYEIVGTRYRKWPHR